MFNKKICTKEDLNKYTAYLIYVRNINDFEKAKNEAIKYCDSKLLPNNQDIKKELDYLALLHGYCNYDEHVKFMREASFNFMLSLFNFNPTLIGGVAKGVIGLNSKIQINIFSSHKKKYISNILEKNNDIFLKDDYIDQKLDSQYSDVINFEDFNSNQNFEIFIYNDEYKLNNFLEYNYYWNIYKLAKTINKLNILNNFEEKFKKDFEHE